MIKRLKSNWQTAVFVLFLVVIAIYYTIRMLKVVPWYDELYTYYYFISRGPVYAAIHWPLPNNHVGYSTLSACLLLFKSPAIALRGISFFSSLCSLVLLYCISLKLLGKYFALVPVFLFAGLNIINQLAVQGRGYALVTCCFLIAIWTLLRITEDIPDRKGDYILFAGSLVLALWAIPSSVYVVVPVCIVGGTVLLLKREYKKLRKLIVSGVLAAICTACLYSILWLAIGSNLLCKNTDSVYYGMSHLKVILKAPFKAMGTGVDYMLATPYIQSVERAGFGEKFIEWLNTLFRNHYSFGFFMDAQSVIWFVFLGVLTIILIYALIKNVRKKEKDSKEIFLVCFLLEMFLFIPMMLIIQCKLPYFRVFSFMAVPLTIAIGWFVAKCCDVRFVNAYKYKIATLFVILAGVVCVVSLVKQPKEYSARDVYMADAFKKAQIEKDTIVAVTDCDQEYYLLFAYDKGEDRVRRQIEGSDVVLIDKKLLGMEYGQPDAAEEWKFYITQEEIPTDYLNDNMKKSYENAYFVLYEKN